MKEGSVSFQIFQLSTIKQKKKKKKKKKKKQKKKTRLVPELTERQSDRQTHRQTESGNFIRLSVGRGPIKQF